MHRLILPWPLLGLGLVLAVPVTNRAAEAQPTYDLRSRPAAGQIERVEATLEAGGNLVVSDDPKHEKPKISLVAKLHYDERILELGEGDRAPTRSIRYYQAAEAAIKGSEAGVKPTLRQNRRLIAAATDGRQVTLFCPNGPLTRDELDLVDVLGSSLLMDRLLPQGPVALEATWGHGNDLMAALFGLDEVTATDVKSKLASVKGKSAIVEMSGQVEGSIGGASSAISMKAKYRFDLRSGRINWFGLAVHEKRSPGPALRGLDLTARLQMQILPKAPSEHLSEAALKNLPLEPTAELTQLSYQPPGGGWQFTNDRRWFVTVDEHDQPVLRMVDGGDGVAHCTVSSLPKLPDGEQVTLVQFQEDIKRVLGENFGQFVRAGQWAGPANYRIYRVVILGSIKAKLQEKPSDLPIQWHYYRVADEHGRQVVFAVTLEGPMVERLGEADKDLVETLRFNRPAVAAKAPK